MDSKTCTLFVIGQHADMCSIDAIEDLRERMKAENSLLVVGGADDNLRLSRAKKKKEGITQAMADRAILVRSVIYTCRLVTVTTGWHLSEHKSVVVLRIHPL